MPVSPQFFGPAPAAGGPVTRVTIEISKNQNPVGSDHSFASCTAKDLMVARFPGLAAVFGVFHF